MTETAQYWLARYTPDLFRQEPRNIGVFALIEDRIAARFFGQRRDGKIDGRALRFRITDSTAYMAWVEFWQRTLATPPEVDPVTKSPIRTPSNTLAYLVHASKGQYGVVPGGKVAGVDVGEGVEAVCDFLYRSLVSPDENFASVMSGEEPPTDGRTRLRKAVEESFRDADLLASEKEPLLAQRKVVPGAPVKGTAAEPHRPDFVQQNGRLWVMAVVDFATTQTPRAKDHAGTAAYIFRDLSDALHERVVTISIVRQDGEDEPDVRWGLEVLRRHSEVIDWDREEIRERFLNERRQIAQLR